MRAVVQRVSQASVVIDEQVRGAIEHGLLVFVGVEDVDTPEDVEWLSGKIVRLRIFNDAAGVMNLDLKDVNGDLLVVSQFTLFASTKKGNRPSWIRAAKPEQAIPMYQSFVNQLSADSGRRVETGEFGADMKVSLVNDGPVTIFIDSKNRE